MRGSLRSKLRLPGGLELWEFGRLEGRRGCQCSVLATVEVETQDLRPVLETTALMDTEARGCEGVARVRGACASCQRRVRCVRT